MSRQASNNTGPTGLINQSQPSQSSGPITHDQRMLEYAQNKLNQLLVFDKVNGRFRLVGSLDQAALRPSLYSAKQSRYTLLQNAKNVQMNIYPRPEGSRFSTRTNQRYPLLGQKTFGPMQCIHWQQSCHALCRMPPL